MRLPLRLLAVLVVSAGLIGVVLAMTVLNTDESPRELGKTATATGGTGETGATSEPVKAAPEIPVEINGPLLGVNLTAYTRDGYGTPRVRKAMLTLAELGTTAVTLVPTWYMRSASSNEIAPDPDKTPSDESLASAIGWAREAGLQVVIKPHVDVIDDTYRGEIQPRDRKQWFRSYGDFIGHYADFSTSQLADLFVAGTELKSMSTEDGPWRRTLRKVRDSYPGPVTYAANWDEVEQVPFWDALDAIGVDAYYPLSAEGEEPTLANLVSAWRGIAGNLEAISGRWNRPVIVTEVGYPSQRGATARPYEVTDEPADQNLQALAYKATFRALTGAAWLEGISWWSWRADHSPTENLQLEYTPEGKKAEEALARGQWNLVG